MENFVCKIVFRDSKEKYFKGITLGNDDLIKDGGHEVKVRTYLKKHGKEGVFELLHEYDLTEDILEEYHIHKKILKEEKTNLVEDVQERTSISSPMEEEFEITTTTDSEEQYQDSSLSVFFDAEDDPIDLPFHDHPFGGVARTNVRKTLLTSYI